MPTLDALRPATADSFDRAAALLRDPRPPRPARAGRRRVLLAAALTALVGACSYPVESEETVGYDVSWTAYGSIDLGNYTVGALDALVPPRRRVGIETRRAERPDVPPDHEYPGGAMWTRVRYTLKAPHVSAVEALADSMRAVLGVYNLEVSPVVQGRRTPLGVAALGHLGVGVNPGDESVSDPELQALLDAYVERLDPDAWDRRFPPCIERLPDGRRVLRYSTAPVAYLLTPATRLWVRSGRGGVDRIDVEGITDDEFLYLTDDGWRSRAEGGWGTPLEDLPPAPRDSVREANGLSAAE